MKPTRTISGSTPKRRASPAATPPSTPRAGSRRSGAAAAAESLIPAILAPSAAPAGTLEARGQQDRADGGDQQRQPVSEVEIDLVEPVEQQEQSGHGGYQSGDQ